MSYVIRTSGGFRGRLRRCRLELKKRGLADVRLWEFLKRLCEKLRSDPRQAGGQAEPRDDPVALFRIWCDDYLPDALIEIQFEVIDPLHLVRLNGLRMHARPIGA